jgi:IS1 family transposase
LEQNSQNSSRPPSTDNPYQRKTQKEDNIEDPSELNDQVEQSSEEPTPQLENQKSAAQEKKQLNGSEEKRRPGKQPGAPGKWRTQPLVAEEIIPHYPSYCASCHQKLISTNNKPYMGYYVLELKPEKSGFKVVCQLHHYYEDRCECGHQTKARPGEGYISCINGRSIDLKLKEYVLVGPMLATLIASLSVRYRMSRVKIKEFLQDWAGTELSVGTIDRCIREAGIACGEVVEKLIEEIQNVEVLHLDETHWPVQSDRHWLWVAISGKTAVYHIGSRRKEELLHLVTEAFVGWLVTDGYLSYRSYPKRQRCLAHLIRKAIALTGAVNQKAAQIGKWI